MVEVKDSIFKCIIKGALFSLIVSLVCVLIFSFVIKSAYLSNGVIKTVSQFIKVLSVFLGCCFFVRGKGGLIKGLLIGLFSTLLTYLVFALLTGEMSFKTQFVIDLLFTAIVGATSGIIIVNVKK